jgi:4-amino-4-deoxy-L-arabinose transferase-like glycosyltransferase
LQVINPAGSKVKWAVAGLLAAAALVVFFWGTSRRSLWLPDETRYASVAREMSRDGDWILPHLNGDPYPEKPPLFFWAVAGASKVCGGFDELSVRIPAAVSAAGLVCITFFFAVGLFGMLEGAIAALVLMTTMAVLATSHICGLDTTFSMFCVASLFCFHRAVTDSKGDRWFLAGWLCAALATLTKGYVGFLIPAMIFVPFLLLCGGIGKLNNRLFWAGLGAYLLVTVGWLAASCILGGEEYTRNVLLRQSVQRFFKPWIHQKPFHFYFWLYPLQLLPWAAFLPAAVVHFVSRRWRPDRRKFVFVLCWIAVPFAFFSVCKSKGYFYLMPTFPAAAIIIAKLWSDFIRRPSEISMGWKVILPGYAIFLGIALCAPVAKAYLPVFVVRDIFWPMAVVMLVAGASFTLASLRSAPAALAGFAAVCLLSVLGFFFALRTGVPLLDERFSCRETFLGVKGISSGHELRTYNWPRPEYLFYLDRPRVSDMRTEDEAAEFLSGDRPSYCLMKPEQYAQLKKRIPTLVRVMDIWIRNDKHPVLLVTSVR